MDFEAVKKLEPDTRAYALIGYYLQCWFLMEDRLDETIAHALKLESLAGTVLAKNLRVIDKTSILKAMLNLELFHDEERHQKMVRKIEKLSKDRNVVAHCYCEADSSGDGITFYATRAKGKLNFPKINWSFQVAINKGYELLELRRELKEMQEVLTSARVAKALKTEPEATNALLALAKKYSD